MCLSFCYMKKCENRGISKIINIEYMYQILRKCEKCNYLDSSKHRYLLYNEQYVNFHTYIVLVEFIPRITMYIIY